MRRKGKVHPSPPPPPPSSASSSSVSSASAVASPHPPSTNKEAMSFLKLLPAAIIAILSILSHEDREVLAYMISRSIKSTNFLQSDLIQETSKKSSKKLASTGTHKAPTFDCDCFECYTSYWFKWDSSPNREVIHQAIEAFEEEYFLYNKEQLFKKGNNKNKHNKKKDKMGRRGIGKFSDFEAIIQSPAFQELGFLEKVSSAIPPPPTPQSEPEPVAADDIVSEEGRKSVEILKAVTLNKDVKNPESPEHEVVVLRGGGNNEKGLARKVLPDVLGLFSSRLWNLWGPNV